MRQDSHAAYDFRVCKQGHQTRVNVAACTVQTDMWLTTCSPGVASLPGIHLTVHCSELLPLMMASAGLTLKAAAAGPSSCHLNSAGKGCVLLSMSVCTPMDLQSLLCLQVSRADKDICILAKDDNWSQEVRQFWQLGKPARYTASWYKNSHACVQFSGGRSHPLQGGVLTCSTKGCQLSRPKAKLSSSSLISRLTGTTSALTCRQVAGA